MIIPVYNDQQNLDQCLAALARQSLPRNRFEVIVVDNGSEPALSMAKGLPLNLSLLRCLKPGSYAARNHGIEAALGGVIAFIDADCVPDVSWLESGLAAVQAAPERSLVGGEVLFDLPQIPTAVELFQSIRLPGQKTNVEQQQFAVTANQFARREDIIDIGPFDESLLSRGDREWCWRAVRKGFSIQFSREAVVRTRYRDTLAAAMIQARRLTGGQYQWKDHMNLAGTTAKIESITPAVGAIAFFGLLHRHELTLFEKVRVTGVAVVLKLTQWIELLRLKSGFPAERR